MKEDVNEINFVNIRQCFYVITKSQMIYIKCSFSICFWEEKQWAVTNRKVYFLSLDKYAHNWNRAFWWPQGYPGLTCGVEENMQGRGRARSQSNACWELKTELRSKFKPDKGPGEKDSSLGNWDSNPSQRGFDDSAASQLGLRFDTTIFWAHKMFIP